MGERERGKKVERGKATERVRESGAETAREEKETKPRDPAEAPKTEQEKEWEAAARPYPPPLHPPCQLCSAEGFHHL